MTIRTLDSPEAIFVVKEDRSADDLSCHISFMDTVFGGIERLVLIRGVGLEVSSLDAITIVRRSSTYDEYPVHSSALLS